MDKRSSRKYGTRAIVPPTRWPSGRHQINSGCKSADHDVPSSADQSNWAALPRDVLWAILSLVPQADILRGAGLVCASWRRLAKDEPLLWQRIDLAAAEGPPARWHPMGVAAVRRSAGLCESFRGRVNCNFLQFLTQRAPLLRTLHMTGGLKPPSVNFITVMAKKLRQLEQLVLSGGRIEESSLAAFVDKDNCPRLQLLDAGSCYTLGPIDRRLRARLEAKIKDLRLPYDYLTLCSR